MFWYVWTKKNLATLFQPFCTVITFQAASSETSADRSRDAAKSSFSCLPEIGSDS
jgi:hypothetical protein